MERNPSQRKLGFGVIVVIHAGLGTYLGLRATPAARRAATPAVTPSATFTPGATTPPPQTATTPQAAAGVNIYQWLPFSQKDLASAASVAEQAPGYYDTFSYSESASA